MTTLNKRHWAYIHIRAVADKPGKTQLHTAASDALIINRCYARRQEIPVSAL